VSGPTIVTKQVNEWQEQWHEQWQRQEQRQEQWQRQEAEQGLMFLGEFPIVFFELMFPPLKAY
jgi:hypothetical protein